MQTQCLKHTGFKLNSKANRLSAGIKFFSIIRQHGAMPDDKAPAIEKNKIQREACMFHPEGPIFCGAL
jgi:hypothetical protein